MKEFHFLNLPEKSDGLRKGECFLEGNAIVNQKMSKKTGDLVTYFKIIEVHPNGRVEYIPVTERLEE